MPVKDVMAFINPNNIIKTSNASVHDLTYNDVYHALLLILVDNPGEGAVWVKLCEKVLGKGNMISWRDNNSKIKDGVVEQCKWPVFSCISNPFHFLTYIWCRVEQHELQHVSDNFETVKQQELDKARYEKLAKSGLVVAETVTNKLDIQIREMEKKQVVVW